MSFLRFAALLSLVAFATACPAPEGSGPKRDAGAESEDEGPPPLADCENHSDCAGGEACRGDKCRTVCEADEECDGYYGRCASDLGYCVACVTGAHCDADERCDDGACVFYCAADGHCADDEACNRETGACFERECERNADCQGGYVCTASRCVSIDPVVCEANAVRCAGGEVATCNGDGTRESRAACDDDERCVESGDLAACALVVCAPHEIGCDDEGDAYVCDATGTARTPLPCGDEQYCAAGVCRNQLCAPSSVTCQGSSLVMCDATGARAENVACDLTPACSDEAFGCACVDAACVARVCQPGTSQCAGPGYRTCNEDGTSYEAPVACTGGDTCAGGACLPTTCTAGETRCSGDVLLTCRQNGSGWDETACASSGETCVIAGATASCGERVCEPLSRVCSGDGRAVLACNGIGTAQTTTPCDDEQYCAGGACHAQVCEPGARSCAGPASTQVCNASGSELVVTTCEAGETCAGGVCQTATCTPDCSGRQCGPDPVCGDSCGPCDGVCDDDGQCTPAGQDGGVPDDGGSSAACEHSGDCPEGEFCSWLIFGTCYAGCANDGDCPGSQRCNGDGQCVGSGAGLGGPGDACTDNASCAWGYICGLLFQTCREPCAPGPTAGHTRSCAGDPDCCPRTNAESCVTDFLLGVSATCQ